MKKTEEEIFEENVGEEGCILCDGTGIILIDC